MAKVRAAARKKKPASAFAYPRQRKYLIHDASHRRMALSQAARPDTFGTYRHVKAQVCKKAPGMAACRPSRTPTAKRKGRR